MKRWRIPVPFLVGEAGEWSINRGGGLATGEKQLLVTRASLLGARSY